VGCEKERKVEKWKSGKVEKWEGVKSVKEGRKILDLMI